MGEMEPYQIPPKPTVYKGTKMRSVLEVTIARALDTLGVAWTYEPTRFADAAAFYDA